MSIRKFVAAIGVAAFLWPAPAAAHEEPITSTISLEVGKQAVQGAVEVATTFLKFTAAQGGDPGSAIDVDVHGDAIRTYLADHFSLTGEDGRPWAATFGSLALTTRHEVDYVDASVTVTPPSGTVSGFTVRADMIRELFPDHDIVVLASPVGGDRRVAALLGEGETTVELDERGRTSASFWTMVHHGFDHVSEGADHLLFLLVLLLPAPLMVAAGRWQPGAGRWRTLRQVVHVVTAFTVGHSVTLVASALDLITVPSRPVEIVIAISVGAGAVHAIRPLVGHSEAPIAAAFGLVHGLAFAGILDDLGLSNSTAVGALFGFNIGVELAQLAAVALLFPSLYAISRTRWYPVVRTGGAGVALVAAAAWVADRSGWVTNPLRGIEDAAVENPIVVAGVFAAIAAVALIERRVTTPTPTDDELTIAH